MPVNIFFGSLAVFLKNFLLHTIASWNYEAGHFVINIFSIC